MPNPLKTLLSSLLLCSVLFGLTACKSEIKQDGATSPVSTQAAGQNAAELTSATVYPRLLLTQVQVAFIEAGNQPFAAACDDPRVNVQMRPESAIESCRVRIDSEDSPQVAIKYSNGWAIVADSQGVRQVDAAQLPSLQ